MGSFVDHLNRESWGALPLPFPQRHPPESRERPFQATGWDVGANDQRGALGVWGPGTG